MFTTNVVPFLLPHPVANFSLSTAFRILAFHSSEWSRLIQSHSAPDESQLRVIKLVASGNLSEITRVLHDDVVNG